MMPLNARSGRVAWTWFSCYHVPLGNACLLLATRYLSIRFAHEVQRRIHNLAYLALHRGDRLLARSRFAESLAGFHAVGQARGQIEALAGLAAVAASTVTPEQARLAARLWRAADQAERACYEPLARETLGDAGYEPAYAAGAALTLDITFRRFSCLRRSIRTSAIRLRRRQTYSSSSMLSCLACRAGAVSKACVCWWIDRPDARLASRNWANEADARAAAEHAAKPPQPPAGAQPPSNIRVETYEVLIDLPAT
jgi:hypothetical protein